MERRAGLKKKAGDILREAVEVKQGLSDACLDAITGIAGLIIKAVKSGNKVILFGNGGSAADSQHIAAEFIGRFKKERPPIPAIALSTNTSIITALSNDYGYQASFKRQLEALASTGDVVVGISTSGNAANVDEALKSARRLGLKIVTMTGEDGGKIVKLADIALKVPSRNTPRIQEAHITAGHIICELVEGELYPANRKPQLYNHR